MKRILLTTFATLFVILLLSYCGRVSREESTASAAEVASSVPPDAAPVVHKYGVKSGIVTFDHSGFGMSTKTVLYFDDWGTREAEEKYDIDGSIKETNLCDGKEQYTLIHKEKTAYKRGGCFRGVAYKFDWAEAERSGAEYKPTKLSNQNIAGKDCESFSLDISGSKTIYAGWNNICFLIETPAGNENIIYKAVSFEENRNIPAEKLAVPADFKIN